jgi:hypothetical protein
MFDDMKAYIAKNFDQGEVDEKIDPNTLGTLFNNL